MREPTNSALVVKEACRVVSALADERLAGGSRSALSFVTSGGEHLAVSCAYTSNQWTFHQLEDSEMYQPQPLLRLGTFWAWASAIAGHMVTLNSRGYNSSFGVSQTYYTAHLGTLSGRLTDAGYFRITFAAGTLLTCIGVSMTPLSTTFWQLILSQGLCTGLGNGLMFTPSLAIVSTYFKQRRALAFGITALGSATGGLIFSSMVRQLLGSIGFAWTVRAMGLVQLITLVMANLLPRSKISPTKSGSGIDLASFQEGVLVLCNRNLLRSFTTGQTLRVLSRIECLLVVNGVGIIGRLLPNANAHHFGSIAVLMPVVFISCMCLCTWPAVSTEAGLYAWASVYGIVAGASMSLFPPALSDLTTDVYKTGVRMGMIITTNSITTLTGPPIASMIIRRSGGHYLGAQIFAGASLLLQLRLVAESLNQQRELSIASFGWGVYLYGQAFQESWRAGLSPMEWAS
ncbi:hypothetical protein FPRO04_05358 [Fusarium proliferatum]|nr:hypothetical protein FPRO03_09844 [Fusarium proliferatum]KAG4280644.1 hypothetical protein FPRO04_05358 [Fusarium proliferatum]